MFELIVEELSAHGGALQIMGEADGQLRMQIDFSRANDEVITAVSATVKGPECLEAGVAWLARQMSVHSMYGLHIEESRTFEPEGCPTCGGNVSGASAPEL